MRLIIFLSIAALLVAACNNTKPSETNSDPNTILEIKYWADELETTVNITLILKKNQAEYIMKIWDPKSKVLDVRDSSFVISRSEWNELTDFEINAFYNLSDSVYTHPDDERIADGGKGNLQITTKSRIKLVMYKNKGMFSEPLIVELHNKIMHFYNRFGDFRRRQ